MADERLLNKIRKLLALSGSSNENEARLAAEKASELMTEHQIEMSAVLLNDARTSTMIQEAYEVPNLRMKYQWVIQLAGGVARMFDGIILMGPGLHATRFAFVGFPDDIRLMKVVFEHLWMSWKNVVETDLVKAKISVAATGFPPFTPSDTMKFKHGHGQGYSYRICQRIAQLIEERKKKVVAATGTALVVVKDQAMREFREKNNIRTVKLKESQGSMLGKVMGRKAGDEAGLHSGSLK